MVDRRPLILYQRLSQHYGPQYWWPAESDLEMMVGAVLTQAVNWKNAMRALKNIQDAGKLNLSSLQEISLEELALLIKSSGYYHVKARRLKALISFLWQEWQGDLRNLKNRPLEEVRPKLLGVWGLGPETVDSILLYAGGHPIFVVDAYTTRIGGRWDFFPHQSSYGSVQNYFLDNLPTDVHLFQEYHALFVALGKEFCSPKPNCCDCFLQDLEESWREKSL